MKREISPGGEGGAVAGTAAGTALPLYVRRRSACYLSLRAVPLALVLFLAAGVFAGHWSLARELDARQVFGQYDVLFNTDPHIRLEGFSHGWGKFNRNLLHPNLANLVNPPVRLVATVLTATGMAEGDVMAVRRAVGLAVTPLVSALQVVAAFVLFSLAGVGATAALLLTLLGAFSFSQAIFGTVPDHWAIGGLTLTLAWILAADMVRRRGEVRLWGWLAVGWMAASITISNVAIVGIIFSVSLALSRRRARAPIVRGAGLVVTALALTAASYVALNLGYDTDPQSPDTSITWTGHFLSDDLLGKLGAFPSAAVGALAPPDPRVGAIQYKDPRVSPYDIQFTFTGTSGLLSTRNGLGFFVFLVAATGAGFALRGAGPARPLVAAALAVIVFNALFHSFWGHEYFLYSQHWLTALLLLPAGFFTGRREVRRAGLVLVAATVFLVALNSALHLRSILTVLDVTF